MQYIYTKKRQQQTKQHLLISWKKQQNSPGNSMFLEPK